MTNEQLTLEDMRIMACDNELVKYAFGSDIVSTYAWEENRVNKDLYQKEIILKNGRSVVFRVSFKKESVDTQFVDCQDK